MKMDKKGIKYETNNSVEDMIALGISSAPALKVGDNVMKLSEAMEWVQNYKEEDSEEQ